MKTRNYFFKTLYMTLVVLLIIPMALAAQTFGQWEYEHPGYPPNNLYSVSFADADNVWAVGDNGVLLYSSDGGFSWGFRDIGVRTDLADIQFVDSEHGWIVGRDGIILHTNNGGDQWSIQNSGISIGLRDVYFLDENIGWAVGFSTTILKTTNGGLNWKEVHSFPRKRLNSIQFLNEEFGVAVGSRDRQRQVFMVTEDGGETWDRTIIVSGNEFHDLHILDEDNIIIAASNGRIYRSSNGGDTWDISVVASNSSNLRSIHFIDENTGWIGGTVPVDGGTPVLFTEDGGSNWTEISDEFMGNIRSIDAIEDGYFVAVGLGGLISTTTDNGITVQNLPDEPRFRLQSIEFIDSENGWIGGSGILLNTTDGGQNWEIVKHSDHGRFNDIFFADDMNGWIAGSNGKIRKTKDGGLNWETIETGVNNDLNSITFINTNKGWVVGMGGTVIKTEDGGDNWTAVDADVSFPLYSVEFIDDTTGFIAGGNFSAGGQILRTTDSGETWEVRRSLDTILYDLHFVNDTTGWAVGASGIILKTENAGMNWIGQSNKASRALYSIHFSDMENGWIVGIGNETIHTTDGGESWRSLKGLNDLRLNSVTISDANEAWAVGSNGIIMKFNQSVSTSMVNLLYPANQSTDIPVSAEFIWGISYSASSYELQIATDLDFNTLIVEESEVSSTRLTPETELSSEELYYWRVRTDNFGVKSDWSEVFSFTTKLTTTMDGGSDLPKEFSLEQNYPNPFNPTTIIEFALPQTSNVRLELFNVVGQRVATLVNETRQAGVHQIDLDASQFASGVYFYRLNTGNKEMTRSMTLIK